MNGIGRERREIVKHTQKHMETLVEASGHGDEESFTNRLLQQSLNQAMLQFMLRDPKLHLSGN